MKGKVKRKVIAWGLSFALVMGTVLGVPGLFMKAHAADAGVLYIIDSIGGTPESVTEDCTDSAGGWSYDDGTATLTLDGFQGEYIEANGDINIVLKGKNKITISAESTEGIKSTGKVTIDDTISPVQDCLDIYCSDGTESVSMIYTGGFGADCATYIVGGTVNLVEENTRRRYVTGISRWAYVENDASLRVNAAELFRSVERVRYAVQRADPSTNPKAACIQFRGNRIFSLDGRRMACDTQPDTVFPLPCLLSGDALLHLKAFGESEVTMQVDERAVCFSSGTLKLYARRYGADTYDPDTAIPQKYQEVVTVRTDELIRELTYLKECAGVCAYPYVRFAGEELSMNAPSGHLATHVSMSGRGDMVVGFDLRYMLDALKQFRKETEVRIKPEYQKKNGRHTPPI